MLFLGQWQSYCVVVQYVVSISLSHNVQGILGMLHTSHWPNIGRQMVVWVPQDKWRMYVV